jgi:hypothetical protein
MMGFLLAVALLTGQSPADTVAKELEQIEQRLATTWKNGDCDGWSALVGKEWSVIHIDGSVITKADVLKSCKAPETKIETFTIDEIKVRPLGDTAVVTGRTLVTTSGPHPATVRLRFTDVFVRRAGAWQVVASQATAIRP